MRGRGLPGTSDGGRAGLSDGAAACMERAASGAAVLPCEMAREDMRPARRPTGDTEKASLLAITAHRRAKLRIIVKDGKFLGERGSFVCEHLNTDVTVSRTYRDLALYSINYTN
eukprot:2271549-Rhodomonas_salina.1